MKNLIMTAIIAAAIATPSMLLAADSNVTNTQVPPAPMYLCHTSGTSETPNSTMGTTHLTCATVDVVKMRTAIKSLRAMQMDASTKAQVDALEKMITYGENGGG
jgi:hypothetical protein